ncbi:MAG: GNAT family N-acetyltransferase/peptidase C39 family protein [Gammaproteobacteria bacterium]|nr:GNAT family N-acetyltransferase/peptidase C39 family protein [Gammaproteobacteria bacterium]
MIRPATLGDIEALLLIEQRCFDTDRISRRSFRYLLTKANAITLALEEAGDIIGYVMVLFNRGTSMARIYSIAMLPEYQGKGLALALAQTAEKVAIEHDCVLMRLEIRTDNTASIGLFTKMGYKKFGVFHDYYEDHTDAVRLEKRMVQHLPRNMVGVPYYQQTLEFTCGPATLMMAMKTLDENLALDRSLELRLWREATTIFMTAGHGGCGPYGMALSAYHRGFDVEIYLNDTGTLFIDSVRSEEKKEVMRLVEQDFYRELQESEISLNFSPLSVEQIVKKMEQGAVPVILISSYRIYKEKFPHWVVLTGYDDKFIYVHDSYVDVENGKSITDCVNMPILRKDFEGMARYGKSAQRAMLLLYKRRSDKDVS